MLERAASDDLAVGYLEQARKIATAFGRARRLPPAALEELVAEVPVIVLELARRYDPARAPSFEAFAAVQLRFRLVDHLRRHGRRGKLSAGNERRRDLIRSAVSLEVLEGFDPPTAEAGYAEVEVADAIARNPIAITDGQRIVLAELAAGLSQAEIARRHHVSDARVSQIVAAMRDRIERIAS